MTLYEVVQLYHKNIIKIIIYQLFTFLTIQVLDYGKNKDIVGLATLYGQKSYIRM